MIILKAWITKYAITKGILEKEVEDCKDSMVEESDNHFPTYYHGTDWHTDKQSAIAKAEEMRLRKIASLKRQIEKLKNMKFE